MPTWVMGPVNAVTFEGSEIVAPSGALVGAGVAVAVAPGDAALCGPTLEAVIDVESEPVPETITASPT